MMTTKELAEHNAAWDKAKAEIFAAYPYDTNFGAYLPASLFSKVAQRAEEIRKKGQLSEYGGEAPSIENKGLGSGLVA